MHLHSLFRLLLLSAIWGASFLFMRVAAPVLGPAVLILARVGLAAVFLLLVATMLKRRLEVLHHWRHYLLLGLFNSALPFFLFAFAAQTVSASMLSILNATAPLWAVLIGATCSGVRLPWTSVCGTLLGVAGVGLLAGVESLTLPEGGGLAMLAGLGAALSYGIATTYTKSALAAKAVEPFANAHGSMWAATLILIPPALAVPLPDVVPQSQVLFSVIALGVVCSGVAYLLYFRLIADIGPASALTVTFLIPVFGILWGALFLDEAVGWHTLAGGVAVLAGTALVTGVSLSGLFPRGQHHDA